MLHACFRLKSDVPANVVGSRGREEGLLFFQQVVTLLAEWLLSFLKTHISCGFLQINCKLINHRTYHICINTDFFPFEREKAVLGTDIELYKLIPFVWLDRELLSNH